MVLQLGHFESLKCGAREGWRRPRRPIVWKMCYKRSRRKWIPYT